MTGDPFAGFRDHRWTQIPDEFSEHPYLRHVPRSVWDSRHGYYRSNGEVDGGLRQGLGSFQLPDGRTMWFGSRGSGTRKALYIPGMPGCAWGPAPSSELCTARDIQLFIPEGAGYGLSTPNPGHTVADGARDINALVDHLERSHEVGVGERFIVMGRSRGGVYAEAFASMFPERTKAVVTICSASPSLGGEGLAESNVLSQKDLVRTRSDLERSAELLQRDAWSHMKNVIIPQASNVDRQVLRPQPVGVFWGDSSPYYAVAFCHHHAVFRYGSQGWYDDVYALWHHPEGLGFVNNYSAPRIHWQGGKDVFAVKGGALERARLQGLPVVNIKSRDVDYQLGQFVTRLVSSKHLANLPGGSGTGAPAQPPRGCVVIDEASGHFAARDESLALAFAAECWSSLPDDVRLFGRDFLLDEADRSLAAHPTYDYTWQEARQPFGLEIA
jgi:pimeloyl-ACP methyl ester carboxylesterase